MSSVLALLALLPATFAADMCSLCVSFLDTTDKADLAGVRDGMSNCQKGCANLKTAEEEMSCALICDHVGADTFTSLIDVSDYIGGKEMCSSHQVCARPGFEGAISALEVSSQQAGNATKKPGNITVNGDMTVTGSLKTKSIRSSALTVNGSITVTHAVRTEFLKADMAKAAVVETSALSAPSGALTISGEVKMQNVGAATSFLEAETIRTDNLVQHGQKQWSMVAHEDFETAPQGWSFLETSSVGGNTFLGGHCKTAGTTVTKKFSNLPPHSSLRVSARYHFIDSWEGESSFLKVDDKFAWMDSNDVRNAPAGINVAGNESPERKFGTPVDVIVPHTSNSVLLAFGSNLDQDACDESFGIDDVAVHVL
jgi:hypothetical protein